MKTKLFSTLLVLISVLSFGQTKQFTSDDINTKTLSSIFNQKKFASVANNNLNKSITSLKQQLDNIVIYEDNDGELSLVENISYHYDNGIETYQTTEIMPTKQTYNYNENGSINEMFYYEWESEDWSLSYKETYFYDSGVLSEMIKYNWTESETWSESTKQEFIYTDARLTTKFDYDYNSGTWYYSKKTDYTYDTSQNLQVELTYNYTDAMEWEESFRITNTFNDDNDLTEQAHEYKSGSTWLPIGSVVLNYDTSYSISDLVLPNFAEKDRNMFNHKLTTMEFEASGYNYDYEFVYSEQDIVNQTDYNFIDLDIYPNPASDTITLNLDDKDTSLFVEVFNTQGRRVFQNTIFSNNKLTIDALEKGLYSIRIQSDNKMYLGRFIKE